MRTSLAFRATLAGILSGGSHRAAPLAPRFPGSRSLGGIPSWSIHPWHIRYASEMRAYSFMLLVVPLAYVFLIECAAHGRLALVERFWRRALRPDVLKRIAYLSCCRGRTLRTDGDQRSDGEIPKRTSRSARFFVVTLVAGMIFLQLMLPCVPQFAEYLKTGAVEGIVGRCDGSRPISDSCSPALRGAARDAIVSPYMELYPQAVSHLISFTSLG